jgi:hypothetical protein
MKGATFQRRPPRTHSQCTHILGTKDKENNNLQDISYWTLWPDFAIFVAFGL